MVDAEGSVEALVAAAAALDANNVDAVRQLAQRVEALDDPADALRVCDRSKALRRAVTTLRAEALGALLQHNDRDGFLVRTSHATYMALVEMDCVRVPRFLAVAQHRCTCGAVVWIPFEKQGGPAYAFECPGCELALLARPVFDGVAYALTVDLDPRPARKRKRKRRPA